MAKLEISKVHDAYAAPGECPLCVLQRSAEEIYLLSFQHSRVMEPNVRVKTNKAGFCPDHYRKLYQRENKLGLALVVHTHLSERLPEMKEAILAAAAAGRGGKDRLEESLAVLTRLHDACFLCDLLTEDLDRYCFTILYLWEKDAEFAPRFRASSGFCIPHYVDICKAAGRTLRGEARARWLAEAGHLMVGALDRLESEVLSFTQLYHDSNRGLGTEAERTALSRTLQKMAGGLFRLE